jgi:hypothetical protein
MITRGQLLELVADLTPPGATPTSNQRQAKAASGFDFDRFIASHLTVKRGPKPHEGGQKWIVQCPFNAEHTNPSDAAVFRRASGKLGFLCYHNGCIDNHWPELRELFEPGYQKSYLNGQRVREKAELAKHLVLTRADEVRIQRIEWLAYKRIPIGGVTLADGPGGVGKTTFVMGFIAKATVGIDFFTGNSIEAQRCLVVGVEDRRAIIVQRLKLYGADLERVHFVDSASFGDGRDVTLTLPEHVPILEQAIIENGIGLIYVDALFSHIALAGEGRMAQQVRAALQPIGDMCERQNVAFLAMRHWAKTLGPASSRALGSVEFANFARSVLTFGEHPSENGLVVCCHTKSNYAQLAGAVSFKIVGKDVLDDNGRTWQVSIASGVTIAEGVTSDDLAMKAPCDPDERLSAAEWLRDYLADGELHPAEDVLKAALKARAGARSTMYRAANSVGVVTGRTHSYPSFGTWSLPIATEQSKVDGAQPAHSGVISHIDGTTEPANGSGEAQTLTVQGSDSRSIVVPPENPKTTLAGPGTTAPSMGTKSAAPSLASEHREPFADAIICVRCGRVGCKRDSLCVPVPF